MLTHGIAILRCDITKVAAQQNEIARLFKLSARNLKAAQQFPCSCSPESLGDVCRNRRTGAPQLRYDPVLFSPRKFCRQLVNFEREFMSFLPNRKVLKRLDLHSSMCLLTLHQSPVTSHQSPVTSHHSPVTSHQSPVTSHQSPVTSHQSQSCRRRAAPHFDNLARNRRLPHFVHVQRQGIDHVRGVAGGRFHCRHARG